MISRSEGRLYSLPAHRAQRDLHRLEPGQVPRHAAAAGRQAAAGAPPASRGPATVGDVGAGKVNDRRDAVHGVWLEFADPDAVRVAHSAEEVVDLLEWITSTD